MPERARQAQPITDFRTIVLTCGQLPRFIDRFNQEENCGLRAPLDADLADDGWVLRLNVNDCAVRERALQIASFVAFVHRTVWQPYMEWCGGTSKRLEPYGLPA
jgi:hypothetical protein